MRNASCHSNEYELDHVNLGEYSIELRLKMPQEFHWSPYFFSFGATAPIWALAYLRETLSFASVYEILDIR
jgi:hypothetical protein